MREIVNINYYSYISWIITGINIQSETPIFGNYSSVSRFREVNQKINYLHDYNTIREIKI